MTLPDAEVSVIVSVSSKAAEEDLDTITKNFSRVLSRLGNRTNITNAQPNLMQGLEAARLEMSRELQKIQGASPDILEEVLLEILEEAKALTPVASGRLRDSGAVDLEQLKTVVRGQISFDTPYAAYVHEILDNYHPVGQAKFLQEAIQRRSGSLADDIASKIKARIGQ